MLRNIETKWLIAIAFVLGLFMEILDMTVLNTALPAIAQEFGANTAQLQYPITGYLVSLAIFIPASGWVADRFGSQRTFAFAVAVFTGASALAGMSQSMEMLVFARVLQGVGGGMLTPVGTAMLFRAFPPHERAQASAILSVPTMIAPAMGPVLGGWLTDNLSWRWIFYINLPIGLVALVFTLMFIPNEFGAHKKRFDLPGFLLVGVALATLLVGLERIPSHGWDERLTIGLIVTGLVLAVVMVVVELRTREPLLDLRLLKNRYFAAGNGIVIISTGALMGILFLAPLMLQQVLGLSATESGLVTLAQVAGMMLVMPFAGVLYPRLGPRRMMIIGFAILAVTIGMFTQVEMGTSMWFFRGLLFVLGVGMAFTMVPSQTATFETISHADTANASSLISTTRQIASAAGVALVSSFLASRINTRTADLGTAASPDSALGAAFTAYQDTFLMSAAFAVLGIAASFLFRNTAAAPPAVDPTHIPASPSPLAGGAQAD